MSAYQPKTGATCSCKRGVQRDNCPNCEGTGMVIDFRAIRAKRAEADRFVCGTRRIREAGPGDWRVVCATCEEGGTVPHKTRTLAIDAAIRDSARPCPAKPGCGAA